MFGIFLFEIRVVYQENLKLQKNQNWKKKEWFWALSERIEGIRTKQVTKENERQTFK